MQIFKDTEGKIPATEDGDKVGMIKQDDQSKNIPYVQFRSVVFDGESTQIIKYTDGSFGGELVDKILAANPVPAVEDLIAAIDAMRDHPQDKQEMSLFNIGLQCAKSVVIQAYKNAIYRKDRGDLSSFTITGSPVISQGHVFYDGKWHKIEGA